MRVAITCNAKGRETERECVCVYMFQANHCHCVCFCINSNMCIVLCIMSFPFINPKKKKMFLSNFPRKLFCNIRKEILNCYLKQNEHHTISSSSSVDSLKPADTHSFLQFFRRFYFGSSHKIFLVTSYIALACGIFHLNVCVVVKASLYVCV